MLEAVEQHFKSTFVPALNGLAEQSWGHVKGKDGKLTKMDYFDKLETFVASLEHAQECLKQQVNLRRCETVDLAELKTPSDYLTAAINSEAYRAIENIVQIWMKQIGVVLAENEQIRREADNVGPRGELDYWKARTAKLNSLLEQLKSTEVRAALGVLHASKSRLLVKWREMDSKVTDSANEARDNLKFLYTLERFCDPLYNSNPVLMLKELAGLMNAVRMINSVSRYYNTSERMTSLLVKVTNQMITACKSYITDQGAQTIWSLQQDVLFGRLEDCIRLNNEYQMAFHRVKTRANERPLELSEMYIFGKFNAFTNRCHNIIELLKTINSYSRLLQSKIEGKSQASVSFSHFS